MKRITALMLTLILMFSFSMSAFAKVTPELDKTVIKAGDDVTVTLTLEDETLTDVNCFEYWIFYNTDKFEFKSGSNKGAVKATACDDEDDPTVLKINCSQPVMREYDEGNEKKCISVSIVDTTTTGLRIPAGKLQDVTFTAKEGLTAGEELGFDLKLGFMLAFNKETKKQESIEGAGLLDKARLTVTVEGEEPASGYTITAPEDITAAKGEEISVSFTVSNIDETVKAYNAFQLALTYDPEKLSYSKVKLGEAAVEEDSTMVQISNKEGVLTITGCGEDRTAPVTVVFTGNAAGTSVVRLTGAKIDMAANAPTQDTPDAKILDAECEITVNGYEVSLDSDFTGENIAKSGEDYTFTAKDKNYDYEVTVTVGGAEIEGVVDNGDGTFTIPADKIAGDVTVETAKKTPKTFGVTLSDELVNGAAKATYLTDYTFTLKDVAGYTVSLEGVTIGGTAYTGYTLTDGTYTIPGADITGAIAISAKKELIPVTETTVTFEGNAAGEIVGGATQKAELGKDFPFEITKDANYDYTVMLGEEELKPGEDGKYVIPAAKLTDEGAKITVIKTAKDGLTVKVAEYLKLGSSEESKTMWLVTAAGTLDEGKVYAYDGNAMFWSEKYKAFAWLVITEGSETLTVDAARALVAEATADKTEVAYNFDVNMTSGVVDTNDAQLVYNMYNFYYNDFAAVSMEKFLRADLNGDKTINVSDAAAVVDHIMGK